MGDSFRGSAAERAEGFDDLFSSARSEMFITPVVSNEPKLL